MTKEQIVEFLDSEGLDGTKKELVQVFERFLNKIEDNPVPSLNKIEEFLYENPHMFRESPYNYKDICFKGIKEILENGVETNKVQPEFEEEFYKKVLSDNKILRIARNDNNITIHLDGGYEILIPKAQQMRVFGITVG
jgi:hypothetical protein